MRDVLIGTLLLMAVATPAAGASILIREEHGFTFVFLGLQFSLLQNGPPAIYDLTGFGQGDPRFELRYAGDLFTMTALGNNTAATEASLPFGLDIYPGNVTPVSPAFVCGSVPVCYNGFGFIPWLDFPLLAGQFVSIAIPPQAANEPAGWALLLIALGWIAWVDRRRRAGAGLH